MQVPKFLTDNVQLVNNIVKVHFKSKTR